MKREDIKADEIYKIVYPLGDIDIFRATKDLNKCSAISTWGRKEFYIFYIVNLFLDYINICTEEEKIWFEYCELVGEYRSKEEALDNMLVKQFIQEYLTEE